MKDKSIHVVIFSAVFAVALWLSVNMGAEYQSVISVPLVLDNIKPNRSLVRPIPSSITVKVRTSGWQLVGLSFVSDIQYVLDVGDISIRYNFATSKDIAERMKLPEGIHTIDIQPETVAVVLDEKIRKIVPVQALIRMSFREGYGVVGDVRTIPDSVTLTGAKSLLDKISQWQTTPVEFSNLKTGLNTRVAVSDTLAFGITATPSIVVLQVDVQPIAEKIFKGIPVQVSQVPGNRVVVLIPPKVDIIIRGGVEQIAAAEQKDFSAYIDYKSILLDTTGSLQAVVTTPRNIKVVKQQPERLQYVVRK